jgi:hypothetical protein
MEKLLIVVGAFDCSSVGAAGEVLVAIGDDLNCLVGDVGTSTDDLGIDVPNAIGFYVWEGKVNTIDDDDFEFVGPVRPAVAADFAEFGFPLPS